jgi:competence protein ComEC
MNNCVESLDGLSFAVWNGLSITIIQALLLYAIIAAFSFWLLEKKHKAMPVAIVLCFLFLILRTASFINADNQKKLIVYNVPKYPAVDIVNGRAYSFLGDVTLEQNDFLRNFHIQPSRIMHRIKRKNQTEEKSFSFNGKNILVFDSSFRLQNFHQKPEIDVLILSKNPKIYISNLMQAFSIKQIVMDGSVPQWKAKLWKKDCDSLHIPYYDVSEKGAFVMKL